jgi:hypothetical protein
MSRRASVWWAKACPGATSIADVRDAEIHALPRETRDALAAVWQRRGGLELDVGAGFAAITTELIEHGAAPEVIAIVSGAVRDEVHHAEISVDLAAVYRGDAPRWPEPAPTFVPELAPAKGPLLATLHVIAMCCINETIACAVLEASLARAKTPLVRAGLQSILSDEVEHARAGWAHLASPFVSAETKAALPAWIKRLVSGKIAALLDRDAPIPEAALVPDHGILSPEAFLGVLRSALDDLVFPGFERAGLDARAARAWAHERLARA